MSNRQLKRGIVTALLEGYERPAAIAGYVDQMNYRLESSGDYEDLVGIIQEVKQEYEDKNPSRPTELFPIEAHDRTGLTDDSGAGDAAAVEVEVQIGESTPAGSNEKADEQPSENTPTTGETANADEAADTQVTTGLEDINLDM